jgi:multiple sugar transport system permease protein
MATKSGKNKIVQLIDKIKENKVVQAIVNFVTSPKLLRIIKKWGWALIRSIFLIGFCFIILYPILIIVSKAFMLRDDLYDPSIILIPKNYTLENILWVAGIMNYWRAFRDTMFVSILVTLLQLASCLLVGYGFARFKFRGKGILFALVIFTLIVPPQIMVSAIYINFQFFDPLGIFKLFDPRSKGISLITGPWPYILLASTAMGIKNGLLIYIFRQFFRNMPKETEEAALVDGAGTFKTFYRIMLPDAMTAIVTVALFSFVWQYNDSIYSYIFLPPTKVVGNTGSFQLLLMTTAYELVGSQFLAGGEPRYVAAMRSTSVLLIMAPPVIIYLFLQRFFIQSIERTGVVG